ncbi:MAG: SH3 domain-containing protein [Anaerolineales bacterium]|nr:SH3 domain-containing protein [Anaerolineales bacterium]
MANIPLYQNDPRWKDMVMGFGTTETIGNLGCLLTCITMVGNYYGGNETPASLNNRLKQVEGFQGPWVRAFKISSVFPDVSYQQRIRSTDQKAPMDIIDAALAAGSLPVVQVDYSPAPGIQSHWIILRKKQGDDYLMWDPYNSPEKPNTLNGRFGFGGTPEEIIQDTIIFGKGDLTLPTVKEEPVKKTAVSKKAAPTPKPSTPTAATTGSGTTADQLIVEPTVISLSMRRQPAVKSGNVIKYLKRTDDLLVLESSATAKAKVGQRNQWLKVKDIEGNEGYVAAWYVTLSDDPAFGVQEAAENNPSPTTQTVVKTTGNGVSLRTEPRISTQTLIKYLPFGTELKVIDSDPSKIGKSGQWLNVQTIDGRSGYVAAWYVVRKK